MKTRKCLITKWLEIFQSARWARFLWVATAGLVASPKAYARPDPPPLVYTVSLNPNQVTEDGWGFDTWLTPWQAAGNRVLEFGRTLGITVQLPEKQRIRTTDGSLWNYNESFHLNIRGHFLVTNVPPNMDQAMELEWWLSGVQPANVDPKVPVEGKPWSSYNTAYRVHVGANGLVNYAHDLQLGGGDFSFSDIHVRLTNYHLKDGSTNLDYVIEAVQVGFNRDNIYLHVPEPSSTGVAMGLAALGFAWVQHRRRSARARLPIKGGPPLS
jgi:uncharacterized protein (TIGR03382 family)